MTRKKKYRLEVSATTRGPDEGDHYALAVHPPLNRDDVYCRVYCQGRTWGGSAKPLASRDAAIDYIHEQLEDLEAKALDDKHRGSVPRYPEPPTPSNTRYIVHPDYEGEIGPREVWGDATLATFGAGDASSAYAGRPWYQSRDAYQEWLAPLRDAPGERVCRLFAMDLTEMAYWWFVVEEHEDEEEPELHGVRHRPTQGRITVGAWTWTSATRRVGGIGITHAPPADCRHLDVEATPFATGVGERAVEAWIDEEEPEPLAKADANQVGDGEGFPSRHSQGVSV